MSVGAAKSLGSVGAIQVYSAFITPSGISEVSPPGSATSPVATVNVNAGTAPFTYSWLKLSGDPITISDDTSDMVTFSAQSSNGVFQQSTWRVTVEDSLTNTTTADINVDFTFEFEL